MAPVTLPPTLLRFQAAPPLAMLTAGLEASVLASLCQGRPVRGPPRRWFDPRSLLTVAWGLDVKGLVNVLARAGGRKAADQERAAVKVERGGCSAAGAGQQRPQGKIAQQLADMRREVERRRARVWGYIDPGARSELVAAIEAVKDTVCHTIAPNAAEKSDYHEAIVLTAEYAVVNICVRSSAAPEPCPFTSHTRA